MRTAVLVWTFFSDHFRTAYWLIELAFVILFLYIFLGRERAPYSWPYLAMTAGVMTVFLTALCTNLLTWRNVDPKMDGIIVKAGRSRYYLGMLISSMAVTVLWLFIIAGYIYFLPRQELILSASSFMAVAILVLLVSALSLLFSLASGSGYEPALAVILIIIGLSGSYFAGMGAFPANAALLLPPFQENVQALINTGMHPPVARSLVYAALLLAAGLIRFHRRGIVHE